MNVQRRGRSSQIREAGRRAITHRKGKGGIRGVEENSAGNFVAGAHAADHCGSLVRGAQSHPGTGPSRGQTKLDNRRLPDGDACQEN